MVKLFRPKILILFIEECIDKAIGSNELVIFLRLFKLNISLEGLFSFGLSNFLIFEYIFLVEHPKLGLTIKV